MFDLLEVKIQTMNHSLIFVFLLFSNDGQTFFLSQLNVASAVVKG